MKKFIALWIVSFMALSSLSAGNVITYTATEKLPETVNHAKNAIGLYIYGFNTDILSHTFLDGVGTITFSDDVTSIGYEAFYYCTGLTSITIPNSVKSIGYEAFSGCTGLTSITIPNSVTDIVYGAFSGCDGLTSIIVESGNTIYDSRNNCNAIIETATNTLIQGCNTTVIPNSVTSIEDEAFKGCTGLTSITIPNSVTSIGDYAFNGCTGLTSITIGNSVTRIGGWAFMDCMGLTSITIPNSVTDIGYRAFAGCTGLTSITIPNSVTSIGDGAFVGCNNLKSVSINSDSIVSVNRKSPSSISSIFGSQVTEYILGDDVHSIGDYTFYENVNLISVSIGNSVTSIGKYAFYGCAGLTSITIPNSATSIGERAFDGCTGLTSITIPNSVMEIGGEAFTDCTGLTSITIGNSVTSIGGYAFCGCTGLTSITVPNSVTSIGSVAFGGCTGLTSITIGNSVTSIGEYAFDGCNNLKSVSINSDSIVSVNRDYTSSISSIFGSQVTEYILGDDVHSIGDYTFYKNVNLISVSIGNSVTTIGRRAFLGCAGLTSITIPNSVTSIGYQAFEGCTGLTSVTIGNSVTSIGMYAFEYCTGLTSITIPNSVTSIEYGAFWHCNNLKSVSINSDSIVSVNRDYPSSISSILFGLQVTEYILGDDVHSIGNYTFYKNVNLISVSIGNSVTSIGENAFEGCTGLTSITIPNSVTSIGDAAFYYCTGLTSITIPNSVTSIDSYAFLGCTGLTSITIPNSVTSIGSSAFEGCTGLTSITIPNSVTSIGAGAFWSCNNLKSVSINSDSIVSVNRCEYPSSIGSIFGSHVTEYILGDDVHSIGDCTFYENVNLISVSIGNSVTSIGGSAFAGCTGLTSITSRAITPPKRDSYTFNKVPTTISVYIPCGTKEAYQSAWGYFQNYIEESEHTLAVTTQNEDMGAVQVIQEPSCPDGNSVFKAVANKGYHFVQWNDGNTDNPRTVAVIQDTTFVAEFAPGSEYTITATCNLQQGTVSGSGVYAEGTPVTLTATAYEHYNFTQWTDGNTDNPRKITVERDATYTAEFAIDQHFITATCDPQQGSITGTGTYDYGTRATLTATANKGYEFLQWSNGIKDNPYSFIVVDNITLEAQFIPTTAAENVSANDDTTPRKVLRDGQVYILRNGKVYTIQGQEIKE